MTTAVIPAAGLGTRMGQAYPKALIALSGTSLLAHVVRAVGERVDEVIVVVAPGWEHAFRAELGRLGWAEARLVVQEKPTGSADAVALGLKRLESEEPTVVVWADQVAAQPATVARVVEGLSDGFPGIVLPVVEVDRPYVWVAQEPNGAVTVGRQRDGDVPPQRGLSDVGIFGLRPEGARSCISDHFDERLSAPRERDFVYVIPRIADLYGIRLIRLTDERECFGVNTPEDLERARRVLPAP